MVLNQKFQRVEETVEDIGERISLMAFNALLEATRAGEAGTGFKIVAEESKRLADRSVQSTGNVKRILA
jgi:methyl-accepting chemotaxis protein